MEKSEPKPGSGIKNPDFPFPILVPTYATLILSQYKNLYSLKTHRWSVILVAKWFFTTHTLSQTNNTTTTPHHISKELVNRKKAGWLDVTITDQQAQKNVRNLIKTQLQHQWSCNRLFCIIFQGNWVRLPGYGGKEIAQILENTQCLAKESSNGNLNVSDWWESLEQRREREETRMKSGRALKTTEMLEEKSISLIVDPIDAILANLNITSYRIFEKLQKNTGKNLRKPFINKVVDLLLKFKRD